ncbi:MAG: glycosyltransferase [Patescibacteria group bacterium]
MKKIQLSIVVPFINEQLNLTRLHQELIDVLSKLSFSSEIIYVDDGSTDRSIEVLETGVKKVISSHVKVRLIMLKRNFGQTAAIMAGIHIAEGKWISFLDGDLQNDPHDLPKMLAYLNSGYDAVYGWRRSRKD